MYATLYRIGDLAYGEPRVHIETRPDNETSLWINIGGMALALSLEEAALLRDRITAVLAAQTQAPAEVRS